MKTLVLVLPLLAPVFASASLAAQPELLAPGVVSSTDGEYSPTFDPATNELVFMRRTPGRMDYTLYASRKGPTGWSQPEVLPFSGRDRDAGPSFSPDGRTLLFDSRRAHPRLTGNAIELWKVARSDDGWGEPEPLVEESLNPEGEPVPQRDEFGPIMTADGAILWYSFRRPIRGGAFYRSPADGPVERVEGLPDPSRPTFVAYFTLSADQKTAVIEGRGARGSGPDLYYACRGADGWTTARPLPGVNTAFGEGGPFLSPEGDTLFFVSDRPVETNASADSNIYMVSTRSLPIPCS